MPLQVCLARARRKLKFFLERPQDATRRKKRPEAVQQRQLVAWQRRPPCTTEPARYRVSPRVSALVRDHSIADPYAEYQASKYDGTAPYIACSVNIAVKGNVPTITATDTSSVPRSPRVSVSCAIPLGSVTTVVFAKRPPSSLDQLTVTPLTGLPY